MEHEILELFPLVKSKGLRLELSYEDSLVRTVKIDGDADMKAALIAFSEEENLSFRTLLVTECITMENELHHNIVEKCDAPPAKQRKMNQIF